jgi:hypothetical protein
MRGLVLNQAAISKGDGYYGYSYYEAVSEGTRGSG